MAVSAYPDDTDGHREAKPAALKEMLKELSAALEQAARTEGAEAVKVVSEKARDILSRATRLVDDLAMNTEKAKCASAKGRRHLEDTIRTQPLMAVGIAALVGFLLASLRRH